MMKVIENQMILILKRVTNSLSNKTVSACGSLKAGRPSTKYNAVLPLRGRVLNVSNKTVDQMLDNKEMNTIFSVIGLGLDCHSVVSDCKTPEEAWEMITKHSRYGKIIIVTDADKYNCHAIK